VPNQWVGQEVKTDKAILDALLWIGDKYAEKKDTVFFINESWTVPHEEFFVTYPSPLQGLVVAAVGNSGDNVNSTLRDFSQRCINNRDTLAVMNMNRGGQLICSSSTVDDQNLDDVLSVGFDGLVSDSENQCGTSFAAPRVAWLLAASESLRTQTIAFQTWGVRLHHRLRDARDPSANGLGKLRLDPVRFLQQSP
jgi:hypothetical protein